MKTNNGCQVANNQKTTQKQSKNNYKSAMQPKYNTYTTQIQPLTQPKYNLNTTMTQSVFIVMGIRNTLNLMNINQNRISVVT